MSAANGITPAPPMTATLTDAQAAQLKDAAQKATPGEWKAVSDPHFDSGLVYTSVQPVAVHEDAMKPMAMMNGEYHVCRMSHTAAPWRFEYHRANAAYIALANPATILALLDEREGLKAAKWAEKYVDTMNDMASLRIAIEGTEAERDALRADRDALAAKIANCKWYWPSDDTSSEMCAEGPWEIAESIEAGPGEVFEYARGGVVEHRWYGSLPAADDADSDDEFTVDEPTEEAAVAKMAAEIDRRAALTTKGTAE